MTVGSAMVLRGCSAVIAIAMTGIVHARPDPPPTAGGWALSIQSSGGLAGGSSTVTVTSEGLASCSPKACEHPLSAPQLQQIAIAVAAVAQDEWGAQKPGPFGAGTCIDCGRTTVTLKRREAGGIRTYEATWDGLLRVAPSLRELTRLVLDLSPKSAR